MDLFLSFAVIFLCSMSTSTMGISTIHHDKPDESTIRNMATANMLTENLTLTPAEREKRLLPYETFYQTQPFNLPAYPHHYRHPAPPPNDYEARARFRPPTPQFTPFLESNALPGAFSPITLDRPDHKVRFLSRPQSELPPNFSAIYENLAQLKLQRTHDRPRYVLQPQADHVYRAIQPTRTTFETFTATSIDIPSEGDRFRPRGGESPQPSRRPYQPNGFVIVAAPEARKPVIVVQRKPVSDAYEAPKYFRIEQQPATAYQSELDRKPSNYPQVPASDTSRVSLGEILKHLQATNTLPKTLTPDNIDRSIKTLVKILDALKKRQGLGVANDVVPPPAPSAIQSSDYEDDDAENEAGVGMSGYPGEQSYPPLDTEEGGTPGKPGVDYPALATIPPTTFSCKTQRYKGFFGDPDTHCQVWHYCDLNGGQASFLCPNGTIFSQVALTCDWWFNVKCAATAQLYVLNERLYKYIIPLSPKFPEDYSGPLVDKYLALKFQEMEEKMRKEKKGKGNTVQTDETMENDVVSGDDSPTASSQKETLQTIEDHNSNK